MAWGKKEPAKSSAKKADHPRMICTDWLLYCFKALQTNSSNYLRMSCKIHAGKDEDGNYNPGIPVTVMARIQPDGDGKMTDILERDYDKTWIHVDGRLATDTYINKDGNPCTTIVIWADKVTAD